MNFQSALHQSAEHSLHDCSAIGARNTETYESESESYVLDPLESVTQTHHSLRFVIVDSQLTVPVLTIWLCMAAAWSEAHPPDVREHGGHVRGMHGPYSFCRGPAQSRIQNVLQHVPNIFRRCDLFSARRS